MKYICCECCQEELKDWSGILVINKQKYPIEVQDLKVFCKPCLMTLNEEYKGWKKYKRLIGLKEFRKEFEEYYKKIDFKVWEEKSKFKMKEIYEAALKHQEENRLGVEKGPNEFWKYSGYKYEDDFYYDHYGFEKKDWFQKHFEKWTTYLRFFQLIQRMIMNTEGPDHRYFLTSSIELKEKEVEEWLEKIKVSKQKQGFEKLKMGIISDINKIFKGARTVEEIHKKVKKNIIEFLNEYENVQIDEQKARENEKLEIDKRKKGNLLE